MRPADALRLPGAQTSFKERAAVREAVTKAVDAIESSFSKQGGMTRNGMDLTIRASMSVLIGVRLHYLKEGWIIDMFPLFGQPPVDGMDPVIAGARFFLIPPQSAYDEVDAESEL